MTISKRGEIDLELDGETYTMVFKYETLMAIEDAFGGTSIDDLFLSGNISRSALAEGIRCGLEKGYRKKTRKQIARLIGATVEDDENAYNKITRAVVKGVLIANGASKTQIEELDREIDEELGKLEPIKKLKKELDNEDPTKAPPVQLTSTG
ncbi:hypothetical protein LCGC14_0424580 [marine sediment metagenome]|uniref:Uncharacterized protein n=1 Tax=marine sediment metagenome TaxID=412755 RepID=A0A0F9VBV7_9ZZZZ